MDFSESLVADSKAMEIMKPGMSTFDYPSILPESAAMLSAAPGEYRFNAPSAQFLSVSFGVVSAVSINNLMLSQRAAPNAADGWNRVDQRQQLCNVMMIGTGQDNRERHPVCVSSDMMLGVGPRAIYGVRHSCGTGRRNPHFAQTRLSTHAPWVKRSDREELVVTSDPLASEKMKTAADLEASSFSIRRVYQAELAAARVWIDKWRWMLPSLALPEACFRLHLDVVERLLFVPGSLLPLREGLNNSFSA